MVHTRESIHKNYVATIYQKMLVGENIGYDCMVATTYFVHMHRTHACTLQLAVSL